MSDFDSMLDKFTNNVINLTESNEHELEVKFKLNNINKTEFLKIIKKLMECNYKTDNINGDYHLRVYTRNRSNVRCEIEGMQNIQQFCNTKSFTETPCIFVNKSPVLQQIEFKDMGCRVSYQTENIVKPTEEWFSSSQKDYRYMNRIKLRHSSLPVLIDASIVRSSYKENEFMNGTETYEVEIELDTIKSKQMDMNITKIKGWLRQSIMHVMAGIQQSNTPILFNEQKDIKQEYMNLVGTEDFVGPSSITLEHKNIDEVSNGNYVITDKADGERGLLFISKNGKIYIITPQLDIKYTGCLCKSLSLSLFDGELIMCNKTGTFINLFAVFDTYFLNSKNIRALPFISKTKESRYGITLDAIEKLRTQINPNKKGDFDVQTKIFTVLSDSSFNEQCLKTLQTEHIYNTDGLIFTHSQYGVSSEEVGKEGPMRKITWKYSFKWKPVEMNTIDFLIETIKDNSGKDIICNGEYKQCILNIGYDETRDGDLNPMLDVLGIKHIKRGKYSKQPFYPTQPYDTSASRANIYVKNKNLYSEDGQLFNDGDIVEFRYDINEKRGWNWKPIRVRHDKTRELKKFLADPTNNKPNYGNSYAVANSVWSSIHNPVTFNNEDKIMNSDIYYINKKRIFDGDKGLRDFHNLYVKKFLILNASEKIKDPILIDYACGKGGDLSKWTAAKIKFVFGIDISHDNIANKVDGAYARYNNAGKEKISALFICGDSSQELLTEATNIDKSGVSQQLLDCVMGINKPPLEWVNVGKYFGIGKDGFNISSCQFAIHYFAKSKSTMYQFLKNVSDCTKIGGKFIGTCYDGSLIYNRLLGKPIGYIESFGELLKIEKKYNDTLTVETWGMEINAFQSSIGQYFTEWLVSFELLTQSLREFGFEPEYTILFADLYNQMEKESGNNYGKALFMTDIEKEISFLNRAFCFKKVRNVQNNKITKESYTNNIPSDYKPIEGMYAYF